MSGFWDGLRKFEEAVAGLDDPQGERFSRIEERLRELEQRLDQIQGLPAASPERPNSSPRSEAVVAAE